eukprot:127674-Lingulodinium_polyedra.AAC.1
MKDPKAPPMGPSYYADLRMRYKDSNSILCELEWDPKDPQNEKPMNDSFAIAIGLCRGSHPNRSKLRQWLLDNAAVTEKDTAVSVGVLLFFETHE